MMSVVRVMVSAIADTATWWLKLMKRAHERKGECLCIEISNCWGGELLDAPNERQGRVIDSKSVAG